MPSVKKLRCLVDVDDGCLLLKKLNVFKKWVLIALLVYTAFVQNKRFVIHGNEANTKHFALIAKQKICVTLIQNDLYIVIAL